MSLPGPARKITVEPIEHPEKAPAKPEPAREPEPVKKPERQPLPEKVPA